MDVNKKNELVEASRALLMFGGEVIRATKQALEMEHEMVRIFGKNRKYSDTEVSHDKRLALIEQKFDQLVTCEKCKCIIDKRNAIEGKHVIKEKENYYIETWDMRTGKGVEYIHIPFYCRRCRPIEKNKK